MHDARAWAATALVRVAVERAIRDAARRARRRRSPRTGPPATGRSPSSRPSGRPRRPRSTRSRPIADIAEREGLWLHVDSAYAGRRRDAARATGAVRGLGAGRFDRRQPAQVAVHAARRVAAADAADGRRCGRRSASSPSTCARSTARRRSATTTSTRRSSGAGSGRSSCGSSSAGSGSRGCAAGSRATSSWPQGFAALGRRGPGLGAAGARPVLDGLLPLAPGAAGAATDEALDERERRDHGRRQPDRRGVPLAHPARRPVHDPASRSATCGPRRATSSGPGRCCARRRPTREASPREARPARRPVLRDDRTSCATGSTPTTRPRDELWLGYYKKSTGKPTVDWSQAVDEALCVGWIDGVR